MKKTIEEVASWYANELIDSKTIESHEKSWVSSIFIAGAKYQSEQMYSEDEVNEYVNYVLDGYYLTIKKWKESKK